MEMEMEMEMETEGQRSGPALPLKNFIPVPIYENNNTHANKECNSEQNSVVGNPHQRPACIEILVLEVCPSERNGVGFIPPNRPSKIHAANQQRKRANCF
jgi:hypothetical protein